MKLKQIIIVLMIMFWAFQPAYAQSESEKGTSINLQLGASTPFGLPANSSAIIPQIGIDFNFGQFGLRANGEFFKTSPEFDIRGYLTPLGSLITQRGNDQHSNMIFGLSPYLNLSLKGFTLQPSLGINYLMQNGADITASYGNLGAGSILNATGGDLKRSAVILAPSIRALLGEANKALRFFAEAGYSMPVGIKEYKITSRNLDGVIRPDGSIDADLMEMGTTISHTEKILPSSFIIGVGIELNLAGRKKGGSKVCGSYGAIINKPSKNSVTKSNKPQESNTSSQKNKSQCCDQFFVRSVLNLNDSCCAMIQYYTQKGCFFDKVEINALGAKHFTVSWDINGSNQWNPISTYTIVSSAPNGLPFNDTTDLVYLCSSPTSQGFVDLELIFYGLDGSTCKKYVKIDCPTPQDCRCGGWVEDKPITIQSGGTTIASGTCESTIHLSSTGNYTMTAPPYICYPSNCQLSYDWEINKSGSGTVGTYSGNTYSFNFTTFGTYTVTITPSCGTQECPPCKLVIIIGETSEPCICQCNISDVKFDKINLSYNGDTISVNQPAKLKGTKLSFVGTCLPSDSCESSFFWEITKPDMQKVIYHDYTIYSHFVNSGIYRCKIVYSCLGNNNCESTTCEYTFFVNVKAVPTEFEPPFGWIGKNFKNKNLAQPGEPVPGAELFLEQTEEDEEPIMASETGANGSVIVVGIQPGDYSLKLKFPLKKGKKKSSKASLTEHPSGIISSNTTDISSLKRVKSYIINCPDGVYNLVIYGLDGIEPEKDLNIIPKYNVTVSKGSDEYEIEIIKFSMGCCKGSVTSTVAFSFYALPKVPFIPKEGQTLPPNITNPKDIKQGSAFTSVNNYGIHDEGIK